LDKEGRGGHGERGMHRGMHGGKWGNPLERLTKGLDLTPDQEARVQPILDQTKPQMRAIHEEAMQKMRAVMENTTAQIRPLLTPEQQQKFDAMKKAQEDMMQAHQAMKEARQQ
jgi:Spy/CpxP family protein refolding chaperone